MIFKCMQIVCAKYYEFRYMFLKNCTSSNLARFAWYNVKMCVISGVRFESRKVNKKANLHENWIIQTLF